MTLHELLPALQTLARGEKLRLIEVLAADVAREEGLAAPAAGTAYPMWSPYDAFEGAATLLQALDQDKGVS